MKKIICSLLGSALIFSITACNGTRDNKQDNAQDNTQYTTQDNMRADTMPATDGAIDVDLSELSSTLVYAEVYNMMVDPTDYYDKTIKMSGRFAVYEDSSTGQVYLACIIPDATACCSQGIEFLLKGDYTYPDDYPEIGTEITVSGIFETYNENGYQYCRLRDAVME